MAPPAAYTGTPATKTQRFTTLDYPKVEKKFGGGSWYGVRAFEFVHAGQVIRVCTHAHTHTHTHTHTQADNGKVEAAAERRRFLNPKQTPKPKPELIVKPKLLLIPKL